MHRPPLLAPIVFQSRERDLDHHAHVLWAGGPDTFQASRRVRSIGDAHLLEELRADETPP